MSEGGDGPGNRRACATPIVTALGRVDHRVADSASRHGLEIARCLREFRAAVDRDALARHPTRLRPGEEANGLCDIGWFTDPFQWPIGHDHIRVVSQMRAGRVGSDQTGSHGVHPYLQWSEFERRTAYEARSEERRVG